MVNERAMLGFCALESPRRRPLPILLLTLLCLNVSSLAVADASVSAYVYDSFVSKHGLGPKVAEALKKLNGCELKLLPSGDGAQLLNRVELDSRRKKYAAQVVIGIDQHLWERAKPYADLWPKAGTRENELSSLVHKNVKEQLRVEEGFLPFDYGAFAFIADKASLKQSGLEMPKSINELLDPKWRKKFILEDPRTSTPGLAFLKYTKAVLGDRFEEFWQKLSGQWLTLAPGWDAAYGLFTKGQAPLVWSYVTSQAYHEEHGEAGKYEAVIFNEKEGHPFQIEGAFLIKDALAGSDSKQVACAQGVLKILVSEDLQKEVPKANWMFPIRTGVGLPASFAHLPSPHLVSTPAKEDALLKGWSKAIRAQ